MSSIAARKGNKSKMKTVTDIKGTRYELTELLGRGGQGAVYAVKGGELAVKIITVKGDGYREAIRNQLMFVRRLPLDELALAKPIDVLRAPFTGYVMELLSGMTPLNTLLRPQKDKRPSVDWYLSSGGLRRRLLLLGKTASIMSKIHNKGLAYGDPSPNNIFISEDKEANEVWFIDTDNLRYESTPRKSYSEVFTPGFAAPELLTGKAGITTLSDSYALSVIAFQALTLTHPFIGDAVNNGSPDLEEKAYTGTLPWIDDPEDESNRTSMGIPRKLVLSKDLKHLFQKAFGKGRVEPTERPSAAEWAEKMYAASDATIRCHDCGGTYYFATKENESSPLVFQDRCPWCDKARSRIVIASFFIWDPSIGDNGRYLERVTDQGNKRIVAAGAAITENENYIVTNRLAGWPSIGRYEEPLVSLTFSGNQLQLKNLSGHMLVMTSPDMKHTLELDDTEKTMRLEENKASWQLHLGDMSEIHRAINFRLYSGAH